MMEKTPAGIARIDGTEYDLEQLSDAARQQLVSLRFADQEIERLKRQLAVAQTARQAYARALADALPQRD